MRGIKLVILCLSFFLTAAFAFSFPANAAEKSIFNQKETVVPQDQSAENVVVIGDNATISGRVRVSVIVINGDLKINKTAKITGPILVIGGNVEQQKGAHVSEQIISLNFNNQTQNSFILGGFLFLAYWVLKLTGSILLVAVTVLAGMAARKRMRKTDAEGEIFQHPGRLIVTGLMASLAAGALSVLFTIIIIGIPITILLLVGVMVSFIAGMVMLSSELGKKISWAAERPYWITQLSGAALIVSAFNFPLIGGIIFLFVLWLSLGYSITWLYRKVSAKRKKR